MIYLFLIFTFLDGFLDQLSFFGRRGGWRAMILWPTAEGVFPHDEVEFLSYRENDGKRVVVLSEMYTYTFRGRTYWSQQIMPERLHSSRTRLQSLNGMLVGKRSFRVYVNPKDPSDAYLSPGYARKDWQDVLVLVLLLFVVPLVAVVSDQALFPEKELLLQLLNLLFLDPWLHLYFAIVFLTLAVMVNWNVVYGKPIFPITGIRDLKEEHFRPASEYYEELKLDNLRAKSKPHNTNINYDYLPS